MKYINLERTLEMLTTCRPAYSLPEESFCGKYLDPIKGMNTDGWGNRWIVAGKDRPRTMFSCHTDTVHMTPGVQEIAYDPLSGDVFLQDNSGSNCLGADDTCGVEIMLSMLERQVPGLYVFHRAEEVGGQGSDYFASADPSGVLGYIDRCIAFDRMGYSSVITAQMGERCMSTSAGKWLADTLKAHWAGDSIPAWHMDDTGVFTDSANYMHLIPECTNLSVGYFSQHSRSEYCNVAYLDDLVGTLLRVSWDDIPTERKPAVDTMNTGYTSGAGGWPEFDCWEDAYSFACNNPEDAASLLMEAYGDYDKRGDK